MRICWIFSSLFALAIVSGGASAADRAFDSWDKDFSWGLDAPTGQQLSYTDETVRLRGGIGVLFLHGDEIVSVGGSRIGHLELDSTAPVLRGSVDVNVGNGFSLSAEGSVAGRGSSYVAGGAGADPANWTYGLQHPDARLDHYFTGALSAGYELARQPDAVVRVHGGFKYTDVQWSARGGTYFDGSANTAGPLPASALVTYRQQLPELFLGFDGEQQYGNIRLGGLLRGGMTILGHTTLGLDTGNYLLSNGQGKNSFSMAPTISAGADLGYALGRNAELFLAARYDQAFEIRSQGLYTGTHSGSPVMIAGHDVAGAGLRSIELTAGLKGDF